MKKRLTPFLPSLLLAGLTLLFMAHVLIPPEGWAVGTHDMRGLFYPWWEFLRNSLYRGEIPWWDDRLFAGYPFLANPQVAFFYPPTWLVLIFPLNVGITLFHSVHLWLTGLGMYYFVARHTGREEGAAPLALNWPALIAALVLMFGGFFTARIYAGHIGLLAVHAWFPWLLLATDWSFAARQGWWRRAFVVAVPLALAVLAGHTTSLLYAGLLWGIYGTFQALAEGGEGDPPARRFGRWAAVAAVAAGVALLLAGVQLLPLLELLGRAGRTAAASYEFATDFSFPPAHLVTFFVPEFFGEPTRTGTWSVPNFEELTAYAGILPLLLLPLALLRPNRRTWLWLGLLVFAVLLAFGRYGFLYQLFYDLLPPFRLARAPGRALFLAAFALAALSGETLAGLRRTGAPRLYTRGGLLAILVGAAASLAATGALFAAQHPSDTSGRLWHQLGGWGIAWGLSLIGLLLLSRLGAAGSRPRRPLIWLLLAGFVLVDLWTFGYKLVQTTGMTPDGIWLEAAGALPEDPGRVLPWGLSIFAQNGAAQAGLESVFGYNTLELGSLTALAASVPDPRSTAYDILGARYVVASVPLDQYLEGDRPLALFRQPGQTWLYERARPLPLARLAGQVEIIPDSQAAIARVHAADFDPAKTVIVERDPGCPLDPAAAGGAVEIVERRPGYWRLQVETAGPALLVLSETAYPGWEVVVDGRPARWLTAYGAVRAVCVPAGSDAVEWRYSPRIFLMGGLVSLLGLLLSGLVIRRFVPKSDTRI